MCHGNCKTIHNKWSIRKTRDSNIQGLGLLQGLSEIIIVSILWALIMWHYCDKCLHYLNYYLYQQDTYPFSNPFRTVKWWIFLIYLSYTELLVPWGLGNYLLIALGIKQTPSPTQSRDQWMLFNGQIVRHYCYFDYFCTVTFPLQVSGVHLLK